MANYLVSYDLDRPGPQNYEALDGRLRALGAVRLLYSQWFLKNDLPAQLLEADLIRYIDRSTDNILIVAFTREGVAWNNLMIGGFRDMIE